MTYHEIIINGESFKLIPLGDCACGCGRKTTISSQNHKKHGWVKDQPLKWILGHHRPTLGRKPKPIPRELHPMWRGGRTTNNKYIAIHCPGHPKADKYNYVREHVLIAEKALGKCLPTKTEIHHVDGNGMNNTNTNLVICQDRAYHMLLEKRTRSLKSCGSVHGQKCQYCRKYDLLVNMVHHRSGYWHKRCGVERYRKQKVKRNWSLLK